MGVGVGDGGAHRAEFNAEIEHQTAIDTTIGEVRPMGDRGAVMADTLGKAFTMSPRKRFSRGPTSAGGRWATR